MTRTWGWMLALVVAAFPSAAVAQPGHASASASFESGDAPYRSAFDTGEPRTGFTVGASIGRGSIDIACDTCANVDAITEGLSLSLHGGFMLTPQLALIGEYWTVRYNGRGSDWFPDSRDHYVAQHIVTAGAQLWLLDSLYLRAGLGVGWHHSDSQYARTGATRVSGNRLPAGAGPMMEPGGAPEQTPAASMGIGWEFAHTSRFAADVQLRVGSTRRPADEYQVTNVGVTFGAAWY